jgi:ribose transport system ATP-binding protein/rhamnose transport system ATP-binding protein
MPAPIIAVEGLNKSFGPVAALRDVRFDLARGEIHGLCGENGAGKSTFVKILMGLVRPDSGSIAIDGAPVAIRNPHHAQALGLGLVAQELSLAPRLSLVDNIWLGSAEAPLLYRLGGLRARARAALDSLGAGELDLDRPVLGLPIGQRQIVEIARLLARDARVLILDEPTATLSDVEIERLMTILKSLRARGHAIVYISHRLGEVFDLCDSVTVFRNGARVHSGPASGLDRDALIEHMLGRPFGDMYPPRADATPEPGVAARGLAIPGRVHGASFVAPRGRVTAIAGQIGSGASLINRALAGLEPTAAGDVTIDGRPLPLGSAPVSAARDVLFVSDDRAAEGLFPDMTSLDNLVAGDLRAHATAGILSWPELRALGREIARKVGLDESRLRTRATALSGGNQQKLLFGRALAHARPGVLLMNEPTRGVDVGARADIYRLMRDLCGRGWTLIMTSSDLEEVVGMADLVYTMYRGRVVARRAGASIDIAGVLADITHPIDTGASA